MTTPKDWALVLELIGDSGRVVGRTKLQKLAFLAKKEASVPLSFEFPIYYYGPYSEELQQLVDTLVANGLVKEETFQTNLGDEESIGYIYSLTDDGRDFLKQLETELNKNDKDGLNRTVKKYGYRPLREVLSHVYAEYVH